MGLYPSSQYQTSSSFIQISEVICYNFFYLSLNLSVFWTNTLYRITVLRFLTPCSFVSRVGIKVSEKNVTCIFSVYSLLCTGDGSNNVTSKPLVSTYQTTLQHHTEDQELNYHRPEFFESHCNTHN